jgi:hypothetical protein
MIPPYRMVILMLYQLHHIKNTWKGIFLEGYDLARSFASLEFNGSPMGYCETYLFSFRIR